MIAAKHILGNNANDKISSPLEATDAIFEEIETMSGKSLLCRQEFLAFGVLNTLFEKHYSPSNVARCAIKTLSKFMSEKEIMKMHKRFDDVEVWATHTIDGSPNYINASKKEYSIIDADLKV